MFCRKCGKEIPDNAIFCPYCNTSTGLYNDVYQQNSDAKPPKKKIYTKWWFWAIIIVVLLLGSELFKNNNNNSQLTNTSTVAADNNNSDSTKPSSTTQSKTTTSSNILNYYLELKSAKISYRDKTPYLVVNYIFTNNSNENRSFDTAVTCTAFQDGIECGTVYYAGGIDGFDIELGRKELQPGKSLEVQDVYELNDTTTPVEIQVTLFSIWSDKVYETFTVNL